MNRDVPKEPGLCSVCDGQVYPVKERWPSGTALCGEPMEFGQPNPTAKRVTVVMLSGNSMHYTLCGSCDLTPENMPDVWNKTLLRWRIEGSDEWLASRGRKTRNAAQLESYRKATWLFLQEIPIGVLSERKLSEVK